MTEPPASLCLATRISADKCDVRCGSTTAFRPVADHFRSSLNTGHIAAAHELTLWATSGHLMNPPTKASSHYSLKLCFRGQALKQHLLVSEFSNAVSAEICHGLFKLSRTGLIRDRDGNRVFGVFKRMGFRKLALMPVEELWELHEQVEEALATKLNEQKQELERRLDALSAVTKQQPKRRRAYPPVFPKFANPDAPNEVWSGRGKKPRWVTEKLSADSRCRT